MRRLLSLFLSVVIVLWARAILTGDSAPAAVLLRDGLLVLLIGLLVFALAGRPPDERPGTEEASPPSPLTPLAWIGFALALVGGGWLVFLLTGEATSDGLRLPLLLWLVGFAVGLAGLYRPRRRAAAEPPGVWSVEEARHYLQDKDADIRGGMREAGGQSWLPLHSRFVTLSLLLLLLVALLARGWNFAGLSAACLPGECDALLAGMNFANTGDLAELLRGPSPIYTFLTALFLKIAGASPTSTLLLGILAGGLSIPLFFGAARTFVPSASALLGTLFLVFSPLAILWGRHPIPGLLLALLLLGLLALRPGKGDGQTAARWAAVGGLAGLTLFAAPPPLTWLLLLWFLITPPGKRSHWLAYYASLLLGGLPRLAAGMGGELFAESSVERFFSQAGQLLLERGHLTALLALLGAAWLLRHLRWRGGWLWGTGFLLVGLPILAGTQPANEHLLAPLFALLGISAVVALDQFVSTFSAVWRPVVRPHRLAIGTALLLALLLVTGASSRLNELAAQSSGDNSGYAAIGSYLYERFVASVDNGGDDATLLFAALSVLENPATQLAARGVLPRFSRLLPLDPVLHLPFTGPPFIDQGMGDLLYIVPAWDTDLKGYLAAVYPGSVAEQIEDEEGRPWASAYAVTRAAAASAQGLPAFYFLGDEVESLQEAVANRQEGPLDLDWDAAPPEPPPFVMIGQGALYIPAGGLYGFRIEGGPTTNARMDLAVPVVSGVTLDTRTGVSEIFEELPQGLFPLQLTIRSGAQASRVSLQWKRPGAEWEAIPRPALYRENPALGKGLQARYYGPGEAGNPSNAPLVGWRVDPWLTGNDLLAAAQRVVWQGKVAAPVEGTYTFSARGLGARRLEIDGILLLDSEGNAEENASLLLRQGWHDLTLHYQPNGLAAPQLLWQPPGSGLREIPFGYLLPLPVEASTGELALPPLPAPEAQPALVEDGSPAGADVLAALQPSSATELPAGLPDLPFSLIWQVGSCGADIEQFQQPRGVALSLYNELVYIADQGNRRVVLRDLNDGGLVDYYTDDAFEEPFDLDVNLLGEIFLLDAVAQTIYQFEEPAGVAVAQPSATAFYRPRGMAMDLNGNFYVADTGGARVVRLSGSDGAVELQVGGPDSPLGQGQPVDVLALPTGAIYVMTAQDGRLWRLDTGESWPAVAPANTFDAPHLAGLTTSAFFVTDPERRLITYYNEVGAPLGQLRSDSFAKPVGVGALILDGQVNLVVSDSAACQVSLWRAPLDGLP